MQLAETDYLKLLLPQILAEKQKSKDATTKSIPNHLASHSVQPKERIANFIDANIASVHSSSPKSKVVRKPLADPRHKTQRKDDATHVCRYKSVLTEQLTTMPINRLINVN